MALTTINSGGVKDDSIVNADIKSDAAIAGTKVAPDFGSQNVVTTGTLGSGNLTISTSADASCFINTTNVNGAHLRLQTSGTNKSFIGQASGIAGSLGNANDLAFRSTEDIIFSTNNNNTPNVKIDLSGDVLIAASGADQKRSIRIDGTNGSSETQGVVLENDGANAKFHIKAAAGGGTPSDKFTINAISGNCGIGTDSPDTLLDVSSSDDAVVRIQSEGSDATDDARLEIKTTNGTFIIQNDRSIGTSGALTFAGNTSNNLVIDHDTGNVGINETAPTGTTHIKSHSNGWEGGLILEEQNANTGWNLHGDNNNDLMIGRNSDTTATSANITHIASFTTDGLKLVSGKGINFSAYATSGNNPSSNLLDDFEKGTWTPTFVTNGASSTFPTQSYANQYGFYTKIGDLVFLTFNCQLASSNIDAGSNFAALGGLPFPIYNHVNARGLNFSLGYFESWNGGSQSNNTPTSAYGVHNANWVYLMGADIANNSADYVSAAGYTEGTRLMAAITYKTN